MNNHFELQVMALAGVAQAIYLVDQVAREGKCDLAALEACLHSVIVTDPLQPEDVFKYTAADREDPAADQELAETARNQTADQYLAQGYKLIVQQLSNSNQKDLRITRYIMGLTSLERKLTKRRDLMAMMGERIGQVKRQLHHFSLNDEQVIANMASIYGDIISPIGPRIQIAGDSSHLQQVQVQNKVRALLLAAMRACVLWRQLGGKRRQLFLNRNRIVQQAQSLLKQSAL